MFKPRSGYRLPWSRHEIKASELNTKWWCCCLSILPLLDKFCNWLESPWNTFQFVRFFLSTNGNGRVKALHLKPPFCRLFLTCLFKGKYLEDHPVIEWLVIPIYRPFGWFRRGQPQLGELLTMVLEHVLTRMILQVGVTDLPLDGCIV